MAKGARASTTKANNAKLKSKVFGPVETDRTARLSAKLLELASQPRPKPPVKDVAMEAEDAAAEDEIAPVTETNPAEEMEVDQDLTNLKDSSKFGKGTIQRRKTSKKKSAIVFPKYADRSQVRKKLKGNKK